MLQKEDDDWVKKCIEYEQGFRPRGTPNEDLERGCGKRLSST